MYSVCVACVCIYIYTHYIYIYIHTYIIYVYIYIYIIYVYIYIYIYICFFPNNYPNNTNNNPDKFWTLCAHTSTILFRSAPRSIKREAPSLVAAESSDYLSTSYYYL